MMILSPITSGVELRVGLSIEVILPPAIVSKIQSVEEGKNLE